MDVDSSIKMGQLGKANGLDTQVPVAYDFVSVKFGFWLNISLHTVAHHFSETWNIQNGFTVFSSEMLEMPIQNSHHFQSLN